MKKSTPSKDDIKRIELKFECIRRSDDYKKDYRLQQQHIRREGYIELERSFYPEWLHFPLLNPSISIEQYRKKKNYPYWLEKTLGGLITSDSSSPQTIKVESPEIRKYLRWKKQGYTTYINVKQGKSTKIPVPKGNRIYDNLDAEKIKRELRDLKLSLDLRGFTIGEIKQYIGQLLKELTPLVEKFLDKDSTHIRPTYVMDYLKIFDKAKKVKSWREITDDPYQKRKYQKQNKIAKILINKGGWHYI